MTGQDLVPTMTTPLDRIRAWSGWPDMVTTIVDQRKQAETGVLPMVTVLIDETSLIFSDLRKHQPTPSPFRGCPS